MRDRQIRAEIDDDDDLKRLEIATRGILKRRYALKISEFKKRAETNKRNSRRYVRPVTRQQNAGNDNRERIEEVEKSIDAAGDVNQRGDECEIGKNLDEGLALGFLPERGQQHEEKRNNKPGDNYRFKKTDVDVVGRQLGNEQLDSKENRDDDDTNFYKPCQPRSLVKPDVSHFRLFLVVFRLKTRLQNRRAPIVRLIGRPANA